MMNLLNKIYKLSKLQADTTSAAKTRGSFVQRPPLRKSNNQVSPMLHRARRQSSKSQINYHLTLPEVNDLDESGSVLERSDESGSKANNRHEKQSESCSLSFVSSLGIIESVSSVSNLSSDEQHNKKNI